MLKKSRNINRKHVRQFEEFGHIELSITSLILGYETLRFPHHFRDVNLRKPSSLPLCEEKFSK